MGVILFNGKCSADYDILIEHSPNYEFPQKDYEIIHVPGKNGDIVIDKGSYKNINRSYDIAIGSLDKEFILLANKISEWLNSASGYARLEDSYEPEYYRLAVYEESGTIENILGHAGRITINFNCKPQRFLKSGDESIEVSSGTKLYNQTGFTALPIITVKGNGDGVLRIGNYIATITSIESSITIDSERGDIYKGTANLNSRVTLKDKKFPKLISGDNEISFSGGITSVEVIPKWWTL